MQARTHRVVEDCVGLLEGLCPRLVVCILILAGALAVAAILLAVATFLMDRGESRKARRILAGERKVSDRERRRLARSLRDSGDPQKGELARRLDPRP